MFQLITYRNDPKLKDTVIELICSREAGGDFMLQEFLHGKNRKGNKIGSAGSIWDYQMKLEIPVLLLILGDSMYKELSSDVANEWSAVFHSVIPVGSAGTDLLQAWSTFLAWLLDDPIEGVIRCALDDEQRESIRLTAMMHREGCVDVTTWQTIYDDANTIAQRAVAMADAEENSTTLGACEAMEATCRAAYAGLTLVTALRTGIAGSGENRDLQEAAEQAARAASHAISAEIAKCNRSEDEVSVVCLCQAKKLAELLAGDVASARLVLERHAFPVRSRLRRLIDHVFEVVPRARMAIDNVNAAAADIYAMLDGAHVADPVNAEQAIVDAEPALTELEQAVEWLRTAVDAEPNDEEADRANAVTEAAIAAIDKARREVRGLQAALVAEEVMGFANAAYEAAKKAREAVLDSTNTPIDDIRSAADNARTAAGEAHVAAAKALEVDEFRAAGEANAAAEEAEAAAVEADETADDEDAREDAREDVDHAIKDGYFRGVDNIRRAGYEARGVGEVQSAWDAEQAARDLEAAEEDDDW